MQYLVFVAGECAGLTLTAAGFARFGGDPRLAFDASYCNEIHQPCGCLLEQLKDIRLGLGEWVERWIDVGLNGFGRLEVHVRSVVEAGRVWRRVIFGEWLYEG